MNTNDVTHFGIALEDLMRETGIRQRDLAKITGLQESLISRVMLGQTKVIKRHVLEKIAGAFSKDPRTSADTIERSALLIAAHCLDERIGPGSDRVNITVDAPESIRQACKPLTKTERALEFLKDAAQLNKLNADLIWHMALAVGMKNSRQ